MPEEPRSSYKHENETKVRLDDDYEAALTSLAKIQSDEKGGFCPRST